MRAIPADGRAPPTGPPSRRRRWISSAIEARPGQKKTRCPFRRRVAVLGGVTRLGDTEIGALLTAISGPRGPGMGRRIAATGSDGSPLGPG
jgi:hypothetical protein